MRLEDLKLADVYIDGGKTGGLRVLHDGSAIDFRGGHAVVYSEDVLLALLRRADMEIHPTHRYKDSAPYWLAQCPYNNPAKARIVLEDGFVLSPENDYTRFEDASWYSDVAAEGWGSEANTEDTENPFEEETENEGPVAKKPGRSRRLSEV